MVPAYIALESQNLVHCCQDLFFCFASLILSKAAGPLFCCLGAGYVHMFLELGAMKTKILSAAHDLDVTTFEETQLHQC